MKISEHEALLRRYAGYSAFMAAMTAVGRKIANLWAAEESPAEKGLIRFSMDTLDADAALDFLLSRLEECTPEVSAALLELLDTPHELFVVETDNHVTGGANYVRIFVKPSELFLDRLATIRAGHVDERPDKFVSHGS